MTTTNTIIMPNNGNLVYEQLSKDPKMDLFLDHLNKNTIPENNNFYVNIESELIKPCKISNKNSFIFECNGLINRLELVGFPMSQYILNLNHQNVATAIYNEERGNYYFDIATGLQKKESVLRQMSHMAYQDDEPLITNRQEFLNLNRIDKTEIIFPKNTVDFKFDEKIHIIAYGYFKNKNGWSEFTQKNIYVYPHSDNNCVLSLSHPTDSIDITVAGQGTIIVMLNAEEYEKIIIDENNSYYPFHRIKLKDPDQTYRGPQNNYLSEEINKNSLNLSRVNSFNIISIGCKITQINQHYWQIYYFPSRTQIFV